MTGRNAIAQALEAAQADLARKAEKRAAREAAAARAAYREKNARRPTATRGRKHGRSR